MAVQVFSHLSTGTDGGSKITQNHFGTNFLFHRDGQENGSDFWEAASSLEVSTVRYPGGTITEEYFDLADPLRQQATNALEELSTHEREVYPLDQFLLDVDQHNMEATIVLPTYRYFDTNTREISPNAEIEIKNFVVALLQGDFGPTDIAGLEIGNEWYQSRFDWTIDEFARFQASYAQWVSEAISSAGLEKSTELFVQAGRSLEENATISSFIVDNPPIHLSGVLTHFYAVNAAGDPLQMGGGIHNRLSEINEIWGDINGGMSILVSEWNVGEDGPDNTIINGLMRSSSLLRTFYEMVAGGVERALIWSTITPGPSGLFTDERGSVENYVTPTGLLFNMLSSSLQGFEIASDPNEIFLTGDQGEQVGYQFQFQSADNEIIFLSSGVDSIVSIKLDVTSIVSTSTFGYAVVLASSSPESSTQYFADALYEINTSLVFEFGEDGKVFLNIELDPYETVELNFVDDKGVIIEADAHNLVNDVISGTKYADSLSGFDGDDILKGFDGNDTLKGGNGKDTLYGGDGVDHLFGDGGNDRIGGGAGNDQILGGDGNDRLFGGFGDDFINAGKGNDIVNGNDGNDTIFVGTGDSAFGDSGDDTIYVDGLVSEVRGGKGTDILSFRYSEEFVQIWVDYNLVEGFGPNSFSIQEFEMFEGSKYNDRLVSHFAAVKCDLGGGDDSVFLGAGGSGEIRLGAGEDSLFLENGGTFIVPETRTYADLGEGDDFVHSWRAIDVDGGLGNDIFVLYDVGNRVHYSLTDGADQIYGFDPTLDFLILDEPAQNAVSSSRYEWVQSEFGVELTFRDGGSIYFDGIDQFDL